MIQRGIGFRNSQATPFRKHRRDWTKVGCCRDPSRGFGNPSDLSENIRIVHINHRNDSEISLCPRVFVKYGELVSQYELGNNPRRNLALLMVRRAKSQAAKYLEEIPAKLIRIEYAIKCHGLGNVSR